MGKSGSGRQASAPDHAAATWDASGKLSPDRARWTLVGVAACFFLSGFAALLYQTAWLRQFSLVFGTSELAVAAVLASYMGGLALGAAVAGKLVNRVARPVRVYAFLEGGIGASALLVPVLLAGAGAAYAWLLGNQPNPPDAATFGQPVFYLIVAFLILVVPTSLMGATLPLLSRYAVHADREIGPRVALLYAVNTAGAVLGTLATAFVLLPGLGLAATVWSGVLVNALVFGVASRLAMASAGDARTGDRGASPAGFIVSCVAPLVGGARSFRQGCGVVFGEQPAWVLPLMLVSGANAFGYEILWTRMLSHVLGGSIYAFATMLATFLSGIALGGGLAGKIATDSRRASVAFAVTQVAIAVLSAGVYVWMQALVPETRGTVEFALYAAVVMLPATLFIGATFTFAVRVVARNEAETGAATARVYAWNTLGAVAGSVLAGFVVIPFLGFEGSIKLAVVTNLVLALWTVAFVAPFRGWSTAIVAAGLVLALAGYSPVRPLAVIARTGFAVPGGDDVEELYFAVGRSATVYLTRRDGWFDLRTNGLPEASVLVRGGPRLGQAQQWLTALPIAARPDARSMLVIGLGGGVALEDIPSSVTEVDVVELEPEVVNANRRLSEVRDSDPLDDERIDIIVNDARNALRLTSKRYDTIVSQPSHPWTAGASHLFTREFIAQAKAHLNEEGVFLQWMSAGFVDAELLRSLAATLLDSFDSVRLYYPGAGVMFFLASDASLDLEQALVRTGQPLTNYRLHFSNLGLNHVSDFAAALILDEAGLREFAAGAPLSTDDRNRMATDSRSLSDGLEPDELLALVAPLDPLLNPESKLRRDLAGQVNFGYIARRLLADGEIERVAMLAFTIDDDATRALVTGFVRGAVGQVDEVREAFMAALRADPGNQDARFALIEPELPDLAAGRASADVLDLAAGLSGPAAAVARGWRLAARQDYDGLVSLESQLAATEVTDLWFPEATQLRADWRTRLAGDPRYANDALRMLDRALFIRPSTNLFMLRAAAAVNLNDNDAFIESARGAAQFLLDRFDGSGSASPTMTLAELEAEFRGLAGLRGKLVEVDDSSGRAAAVSDLIGEVLRRIQVAERGFRQ